LCADYGLSLLSAALVAAMKARGFSFAPTFVALWAFDLAAAGFFIVFYYRTGEDLSLGEDFRRAVDTVHEKSRLIGWVAMALVIGRAIFWTGPERVIIFFRKEIGTTFRVIVTLLILTALQAIIWTVLYGLGYELLSARWF
jgi:hypothetical protein